MVTKTKYIYPNNPDYCLLDPNIRDALPNVVQVRAWRFEEANQDTVGDSLEWLASGFNCKRIVDEETQDIHFSRNYYSESPALKMPVNLIELATILGPIQITKTEDNHHLLSRMI